MFSFFKKKKVEVVDDDSEDEVEDPPKKGGKGNKDAKKGENKKDNLKEDKKDGKKDKKDKKLEEPAPEKEAKGKKDKKEGKKEEPAPEKETQGKKGKKLELAPEPEAKGKKDKKDKKPKAPSPDMAPEVSGPEGEESPKKGKKKEKTEQYVTDGGKVQKKKKADNRMETLPEEDETMITPKGKQEKRSSVIDDLMEDDWKAVGESLPVYKTPEAREQRKAMFEAWDPDGNGTLTLAQIKDGIKQTKGLEQLYKCKPAMIRAYNAAKTLKSKPEDPDEDDDFVSSVEFRMLLVFLKLYFGLYQIFKHLDANDDHKVDREEFTAATPQLREWGCPIEDPEETFDAIDTNGNGTLAFDEFSEWAIANNLLVTKTDAEAASVRASKAEPEPEAPRKPARRASVIDDLLKEDWKVIAERLPVHKSDEDKKKRKALFKQWDPNGNGMLSLAEVDKGVKETAGLEKLYKCKPALIRAFNAAKDIKPGDPNKKGLQDDDYVTGVEFRMLLIYLKLYFGLFQIFDKIDTGDDRRVDITEFKAAAPSLREWGCPIDDPEETFHKIDEDGHGQILFDEFSRWAIGNNLLITTDEAEDADPAQIPAEEYKRHGSGVVHQKPTRKDIESEAGEEDSGEDDGEEDEEEEEAPRARTEGSNEEKMSESWKVIANTLPWRKSREDTRARKKLFRAFDPNGNGMLSLAEVDKALQETPGLEELYKCKPAVLRAFTAAKNVKPADPNKKGLQDDDYVSRLEFRMLLVYLKLYYGLFQIFESINSGGDRRVDKDEFREAAPNLREWGLPIAEDTDETFNEIDGDGAGQILFNEFSEWAIKHNMLNNEEAAPSQPGCGVKLKVGGGAKKPAGDGKVVLEGLLNDYARVENKVSALNKELLDMRKQIMAAMGGSANNVLGGPKAKPAFIQRSNSDNFRQGKAGLEVNDPGVSPEELQAQKRQQRKDNLAINQARMEARSQRDFVARGGAPASQPSAPYGWE